MRKRKAKTQEVKYRHFILNSNFFKALATIHCLKLWLSCPLGTDLLRLPSILTDILSIISKMRILKCRPTIGGATWSINFNIRVWASSRTLSLASPILSIRATITRKRKREKNTFISNISYILHNYKQQLFP